MTRPTRDQLYLEMAELIARRGTCPRRAVGCVLVDRRGRVLATGYNGVAPGRPHCSEGFPCPGAEFPSGQGLDKCEAIHAEQNAVLLVRDPFVVDTVYLTASPCLSCVKLLLGTSAKRIVCREIYPHPDALEWWHRAGRQLIQLAPLTTGRDEADANLIAAAPELFEALERLVEHAEAMEAQHSDYHELGETQPCRSRPLNEAIAALAKARGQ